MALVWQICRQTLDKMTTYSITQDLYQEDLLIG